jgi:hypothetical protein
MIRTSRHEMDELLRECVDDVEARLGFRPDVHLDWPCRTRVPAPVARAVRDALDESLDRLVGHDGTTSAFASVAWRADTIEICVVDDGRAPTARVRRSSAHLDEATGVEHDVDDYGAVGTCQWWSIPMDLAADS